MPPPDLHILLGLTNDMFNLIRDRLSKEHQQLLKDFCKRWCLEREDYYGGGAEKNELRGQFAGNKYSYKQ